MTEKRFTLCHQQNDKIGWTMSIVDWETNEPFDYTQYEVHSESITNTKEEMEDLCLLINQLNDENKQLKHDATVLIQSNMDYRKENEQLKQALREQLEENGNSHYIELLDKIFDLEYDEWQRKMNETHTYDYTDWDKVLKEKGDVE